VLAARRKLKAFTPACPSLSTKLASCLPTVTSSVAGDPFLWRRWAIPIKRSGKGDQASSKAFVTSLNGLITVWTKEACSWSI
jgi:hypothetical protein